MRRTNLLHCQPNGKGIKPQVIKKKSKLKQIVKCILPVKLQIILMGIIKNICADNKKNIQKQIQVNKVKHEVLGLLPTLEPIEDKKSPRYIFSLTSYGNRLADTAPYAIITLFKQNVKPDKIILWVAHEDKKNIPQILEKLTERGLEIRFCDDIKSYKKLIPSIENFPNDYIITADDDVYYHEHWFEQLVAEHKKNHKKIICHRAHGIKVDKNHNPMQYIKWHSCIEPNVYFAPEFESQEKSMRCHQLESVFPTGSAGVLYPPNCLHRDVVNKEVYMKLAPNADDIWFWAMALINKEYFGEESPYVVVKNSYLQTLSEIDPEQTKKNALWAYNSQGGNDKQMKLVIKQYPQINKVLKKIKPF